MTSKQPKGTEDSNASTNSNPETSQMTLLLSQILQRLENLEQARASNSVTSGSEASVPSTTNRENFVLNESEHKQVCLIKMSQKLPQFDGQKSNNPMLFLRDLRNYIEMSGNSFSSGKALAFAIESLIGSAKTRMNIYRDSWASFSDFERDYKQVFWSNCEQELIRQRFMTAKYDDRVGTMEEYFADQLNKIYGLSLPFTETEKVNTIFRQLPQHVQVAFFARNESMSVKNAVEFLRHLERNVRKEASVVTSAGTSEGRATFRPSRGTTRYGSVRVNTIRYNHLTNRQRRYPYANRGQNMRGRGLYNNSTRQNRTQLRPIEFTPALDAPRASETNKSLATAEKPDAVSKN